jgi:outer membrane lipoprotein SlyB
MNTATAASMPTSQSMFNTKTLWAAVGVLGVSVLALGAALVHVSNKPDEPMITETAEQAGLNSLSPNAQSLAGVAAAGAAGAALQKDKAPVQSAQAKQPKPMQAKPTTASRNGEGQRVAAANPQPLATQPVQQRVVCETCGTVESVTPVTRKGQGTGLGAVGGAVLGGVLGHQVGSGRGNDLATVVGAVGGGVVGHKVEQNVRKTTVYQVRVRMDDGSSRTIEQASAPAVGSKVTVDGNSIRGAQRAPTQQAPSQPGMVYTNG